MCYGKTGGEYPIALICPQKPRLLQLGSQLGLSEDVLSDFDKLCKEPKVIEKVSEACKAKCKEQKLVAFEIPTRYALISELWTPENDMLTAAMKLKRPLIATKHMDAIASC